MELLAILGGAVAIFVGPFMVVRSEKVKLGIAIFLLGLAIFLIGLAAAISKPPEGQPAQKSVPTSITAQKEPAPEQKKLDGSAVLRAIELEKQAKEQAARKKTKEQEDKLLVQEMKNLGVACDIWKQTGSFFPTSYAEPLDIFKCARFAERIRKKEILQNALLYAHDKLVSVSINTYQSAAHAGRVQLSVEKSDDEIIRFLLGCHPAKDPQNCPQDFREMFDLLKEAPKRRRAFLPTDIVIWGSSATFQ